MPDISFLSSAKNSSFSSIGLPTWGAYTDTTFRIILPTASLKDNSLSLTLLTPTTCSNHFSDIITPTPAKPRSQPLQYSLYLAPSTTNVLVFPPFQRVSCEQHTSKRLLPTISTISPVLPCSVPTFALPTLNLVTPVSSFRNP